MHCKNNSIGEFLVHFYKFLSIHCRMLKIKKTFEVSYKVSFQLKVEFKGFNINITDNDL